MMARRTTGPTEGERSTLAGSRSEDTQWDDESNRREEMCFTEERESTQLTITDETSTHSNQHHPARKGGSMRRNHNLHASRGHQSKEQTLSLGQSRHRATPPTAPASAEEACDGAAPHRQGSARRCGPPQCLR